MGRRRRREGGRNDFCNIYFHIYFYCTRPIAGVLNKSPPIHTHVQLPGSASPWNSSVPTAAVCGPPSSVMETMTVATTLMRETAVSISIVYPGLPGYDVLP